MSREKVDIPEDLQAWVEDVFGDAAKSRAEAYRMAIWYARERYEAEHGAPRPLDKQRSDE